MAISSFQEWMERKILVEKKSQSPDYSFDNWLKQTRSLGDTVASMKDDAKKKDQELDDKKKTKEEEEEKEKNKSKDQEAEWSRLVDKFKKATDDKEEEDSSTSQKK